nr:unnamed protein product [Callosobruchus chinensis]
MAVRSALIIFSLTLTCSVCEAAFPAGLRSQLPTQLNSIEDIKFSCDVNSFNITLNMRQPFKGLLFAKDFAQECRMLGTSSSTISIGLPTSGCGVSLTSSPLEHGTGGVRMSYKVHLVVQQDRHLRQITDIEREVECQLPEEAFLVRSTPLVGVLREELKGGKIKHRVGRMKDAGWSKELEGKQLEEELEEALAAARAWMEITSAHSEVTGSDVLQVGETALLVVKSTLPAGVGWSVTDCVAYDGLGDCSQRLIDQVGCPIDPLLVPGLRYALPRPIALMRHQEASTIFPAFKFPDRDRVHLKCSLRLCRGPCARVDCDDDDSSENRTGKFLLETIEAEVIDRIEVFNSMEVISPEIDDLRDGESYLSGKCWNWDTWRGSSVHSNFLQHNFLYTLYHSYILKSYTIIVNICLCTILFCFLYFLPTSYLTLINT